MSEQELTADEIGRDVGYEARQVWRMTLKAMFRRGDTIIHSIEMAHLAQAEYMRLFGGQGERNDKR